MKNQLNEEITTMLLEGDFMYLDWPSIESAIPNFLESMTTDNKLNLKDKQRVIKLVDLTIKNLMCEMCTVKGESTLNSCDKCILTKYRCANVCGNCPLFNYQ